MGINPFKDSNLDDLQKNFLDFIKDHFGEISKSLKELWKLFVLKGKERVTIMFIPHNEKKILNFHISIFSISIISSAILIIVSVTSVMIINHSSTIKEVSKLKKYKTYSKIQKKNFKEEINTLYETFQKFKPEIKHLYSLTPNNKLDSLWAKGGVQDKSQEDISSKSPSDEVLYLKEIIQELKTTKKVISEIKKFISYRKKIISHTPSIWPVDGYIISRFGKRSSPYSFKTEFHNGIDIEAFPCAEIRATAPGKVVDINWTSRLGLTIVIKHKYGFTSLYSHCQRTSVKLDQKISKGDIIGYVGKTGKTTRYICYYQVKIGTNFVNPMPYLNRIVH